MKKDKYKKITCPRCKKTGNYKTQPNYCAYCGTNLLTYLNNHNK